MGNISGKVVVVLGAGMLDNMGQVIARRFAAAGAKVLVAGRNEEVLADLAAEFGGAHTRCDITSERDLAALAEAAHARFGGLDIAINTVGKNLVADLLDVTPQQLDEIVAVQFTGSFRFLQAMVRGMRRGGSIIQISTVTARSLLHNHAAYMATKAGADMLVRAVAYDYGPRGIRVNSISPGPTLDTPMAAEMFCDPEATERIRREIPLRRIGTAADIAEAALWLASDECFVTGENLQVNGGLGLSRLREAFPEPQGSSDDR